MIEFGKENLCLGFEEVEEDAQVIEENRQRLLINYPLKEFLAPSHMRKE